ncbi:MAG: NAD(P)-dependent oxidoreductase [Candidatus Bathyarchaeia archaeon]
MNVVIVEKIHENGIDFLRKNNVNVELLYESKRPLEEAIKEADGVIVRLAKITEQLLKIGKRNSLKVVAKHGIGVDNIDVDAAKNLGIRVVYTPEVMANAVAEFTLGAILMLAKKYDKYNFEVRNGRWNVRYTAENIEIKGKIIGIIGYGRIGKRVAELSRCFGASVLVYDPYVKVQEDFVHQTDLPVLLKKSDFITIHAPLTKATFHMIGLEELRLIKQGGFIINTARGGIIDEDALCQVIGEGRLGGAVLDTTESEPVRLDNKLLRFDNVIFTAHTAGLTDVSVTEESLLACKQVLQVLNGEEPTYVLV